MGLAEELSQFYLSSERSLKLSYKQLVECNYDIGFTSIIEDGKDFHKLTKDIVLSVMKFHDQALTNLVFSNKQPIRLHLVDKEIIDYYSDYIELRYILTGHLAVEIEGNTHHFYENEVLFIDSMAYHKESIDNSECVLLNVSISRDIITESFLGNVNLTPL